jgi:hypothetical protein
VPVEQPPKALPARIWFASVSKISRKGVESVESLLVSIGAPRLRGLGFVIALPLGTPEQRLYRPLESAHADVAQSRYNALVRRLVSCERAAAAAGFGPDA